MTGPNYYYAEAVAAERIRKAADRNQRKQLLAAAGTDHPVRRRFSEVLLSLGLRLSPQRLELVAAPRSCGC